MRNESRRRVPIWLGLALPASLCACATARLHAPEELSAVGRACGTAEGEVVQDAEEPRILFFYAVGPTRAEIACLAGWSRKYHLHLAYIQAVNWQNQ
jgi:hypothetical protein